MDQHTASPPDVDRTQPEFDRRRGPRRADAADVPFEERRQGDRRKRKPGLAGLWGALFGHREDDEPAL
ncbi:MAG: hypothetical protein QOD51_2792 [Candidatus Eremiobacteraeota bacterium]|jgi:hypothetical protein|nr:hypothetical protein [Candidatus Eremiobacteraeota bacterium]